MIPRAETLILQGFACICGPICSEQKGECILVAFCSCCTTPCAHTHVTHAFIFGIALIKQNARVEAVQWVHLLHLFCNNFALSIFM
eukprot:1161685-Pelagomonas_calceolata.AAC.8